MLIDVEEKFKRNIIDVYGTNYSQKIKKIFPSKELSYWEFTLDLIRKDLNKTFWDSELDREWLVKYLPLFFKANEPITHFTIDEWFNYLNSK